MVDLSASVLLQSKTLSLNPAKKAVLTLHRPFGSETSGLQPVPVTEAPVLENNDVRTELEEPATESVTSRPDEVHFWCICQLRWKIMMSI